jgi:hypothetical protein
MKKIIYILIFAFILSPTFSFASSNGCFPGYKFDPMTGKSCSSKKTECAKGDLFSFITGKSCVNNSVKQKACLIAQDEFGELSNKMISIQKDYANKIDKVKNVHPEVVKLQQKRFSLENRVYEKLKLARNKVGYSCEHLPKLPDLPKKTSDIEQENRNKKQCGSPRCGGGTSVEA